MLLKGAAIFQLILVTWILLHEGASTHVACRDYSHRCKSTSAYCSKPKLRSRCKKSCGLCGPATTVAPTEAPTTTIPSTTEASGHETNSPDSSTGGPNTTNAPTEAPTTTIPPTTEGSGHETTSPDLSTAGPDTTVAPTEAPTTTIPPTTEGSGHDTTSSTGDECKDEFESCGYEEKCCDGLTCQGPNFPDGSYSCIRGCDVKKCGEDCVQQGDILGKCDSEGMCNTDLGSDLGCEVDECPEICPEIFEPVCGSDGKTYDNACKLKMHACYTQDPHLKIEHEGKCKDAECPKHCPEIHEPVCGTDGNTYNNECELKVHACYTHNHDLKVEHEGKCKECDDISSHCSKYATADVCMDETDVKKKWIQQRCQKSCGLCD